MSEMVNKVSQMKGGVRFCERSLLFGFIGLFAVGTLYADVIVDPSVIIGRIKPMNAVNNGPKPKPVDQFTSNFEAYEKLEIPFARTHDANFCSAYGGPHTVDVSAVFPNFDADENDTNSYDFACTDKYVGDIIAAGTEPYFRLGQTIEHQVKKHHIFPPKDFAKWARICEHIIRHYTEGWSNGFTHRIRYWEIWNEFDNFEDSFPNEKKTTWGGTEAQFHDFYETVAKHLKGVFPHLMIGGPSLAYREQWGYRFIKEMSRRKVPLDFYSWHYYWEDPKELMGRGVRMRKWLDESGYEKTESHLNEWNYVRDFQTGFVYSLEMEKGMKGAAYAAAVMCECQNGPVDVLMYYDARIGTGMNGLFSHVGLKPLKTYWAFLAWAKLAKVGTQVKCDLTGKDAECKDIWVTAVADEGRIKILLVRYNKDDNVTTTRPIRVGIGRPLKGAMVRMCDNYYSFGEFAPQMKNDDLLIPMMPESFVLIEQDDVFSVTR